MNLPFWLGSPRRLPDQFQLKVYSLWMTGPSIPSVEAASIPIHPLVPALAASSLLAELDRVGDGHEPA
jgi:hypothetical protein